MADSIGKRVGARIRQLRVAAGLTQAELAERARPPLETETIGRFERGERTPPLERLVVLAAALGTDLDGLLGGMLHLDGRPPLSPEMDELLALLRDRTPPERAGALKVVRAYLEALDAAR